MTRSETRRPLWPKTQQCVRAWRRFGCSEYLCRAIQFGIFDQPTTPFRQGEGVELPQIPQSPEDLAFGLADLKVGCQEDIYRKVTPAHAERARELGAVISSAFTVSQDGPEGPKGLFVVNLSLQSTHWKKGSLRMESLPEFATSIQKNDHFLSMDIQKGYRHFRLGPAMRDCSRLDGEGLRFGSRS